MNKLFEAVVYLAAALFVAAVLLVVMGKEAHAQYLDTPGTPHTTIHDYTTNVEVQVGVWAVHTPYGDALVVAEKSGATWLAFWASNLYEPFFPASVLTPDGAKAFINGFLPQINGAIKNRFAIPENGPAPTGIASLDAINQSLYQSFEFRNLQNGTVVLAPR